MNNKSVERQILFLERGYVEKQTLSYTKLWMSVYWHTDVNYGQKTKNKKVKHSLGNAFLVKRAKDIEKNLHVFESSDRLKSL